MRRAALLSEQANVWTYPGAFSLGSNARRGLKDHPTAKPSAMPKDALLDLTHRGDIVVDPFLGSGSTLIGTEKTGRVRRGVELDALYVDVTCGAMKRPPTTQFIGETFEALGRAQAREAPPV